MIQNDKIPFIFYLTINESFSHNFYTLCKVYKSLGFVIVPITIDQLQKLASLTEQTQMFVLSSVENANELKLYNLKVRGILKYILKSKRITFLNLSSFSSIDDSKSFSNFGNYFFLRYPLDAYSFAEKVASYYILKSEHDLKWPGSKRDVSGEIQ